jgi:hypothetical protein
MTLTNEATNRRRVTATNEIGEYAFNAVEAGTYVLRARSAGYKTFEQRDLEIGTQTFVTIDASLAVADLESSVTEIAQTPVLETANASKGAVIDRQTLQALPSAKSERVSRRGVVPTIVFNSDPRFTRQQESNDLHARLAGRRPTGPTTI